MVTPSLMGHAPGVSPEHVGYELAKAIARLDHSDLNLTVAKRVARTLFLRVTGHSPGNGYSPEEYRRVGVAFDALLHRKDELREILTLALPQAKP